MTDQTVKYAIEYVTGDQVSSTDFRNTIEEVHEVVDSDPRLKQCDRCVRVWKMTLVDIRK